MRPILLLLMTTVYLVAFEQKTELGLTGIAYNRYSNEAVLNGESEIAFKNEYFQTDVSIEFFYSSEYKKRRYLLLQELYISKDFDSYTLSLGKRVKYWGELEGFNTTDIYNQKNYLKDPFDKSAKYGAIGGDAIRYFDENSVEFGVKFYETDIKLPTGNAPYAPFLLNYDKRLYLSDERYTPTYYIKANLTSNGDFDTETSLVLLHGYDHKRSFIPVSKTTLAQYAYRVNKALLFSHIVYNDTIFKTELAYTDVIKEHTVSDYSQLGIGIEHSFYEVIGNSDITLFGEYYKYIYADKNKIKNIDISEVYDNDLFFAFRLSFNNVQSSELKVGILQDIQKDERVVKANLSTRIHDSFVIEAEYLNIETLASKTILSRFDSSSRFMLSLYYTF